METITMHYKAKNDVNGNPRRCYVVYDATSKNGVNSANNHNFCVCGWDMGYVVAVYDEGYTNWIDNKEHRNVVDSIEVPVGVYNVFIKLGKELGDSNDGINHSKH